MKLITNNSSKLPLLNSISSLSFVSFLKKLQLMKIYWYLVLPFVFQIMQKEKILVFFFPLILSKKYQTVKVCNTYTSCKKWSFFIALVENPSSNFVWEIHIRPNYVKYYHWINKAYYVNMTWIYKLKTGYKIGSQNNCLISNLKNF